MGDLFSPGHIVLVVLVALLLFGPSKLPELGKGFGKMLREFKAGARGIYSDDEEDSTREKNTSQTVQAPKKEDDQIKKLPE